MEIIAPNQQTLFSTLKDIQPHVVFSGQIGRIAIQWWRFDAAIIIDIVPSIGKVLCEVYDLKDGKRYIFSNDCAVKEIMMWPDAQLILGGVR